MVPAITFEGHGMPRELVEGTGVVALTTLAPRAAQAGTADGVLLAHRFGLNYDPSRNWYYSWNHWDASTIARDVDVIHSIGADGFILLTSTLLPERRVIAKGGTLRFSSVNGRRTLWIDGKQVAEKTTRETGVLEYAIAAGDKPREIALILEAVAGERTGLPGVVVVEAKRCRACQRNDQDQEHNVTTLTKLRGGPTRDLWPATAFSAFLLWGMPPAALAQTSP